MPIKLMAGPHTSAVVFSCLVDIVGIYLVESRMGKSILNCHAAQVCVLSWSLLGCLSLACKLLLTAVRLLHKRALQNMAVYTATTRIFDQHLHMTRTIHRNYIHATIQSFYWSTVFEMAHMNLQKTCEQDLPYIIMV